MDMIVFCKLLHFWNDMKGMESQDDEAPQTNQA